MVERMTSGQRTVPCPSFQMIRKGFLLVLIVVCTLICLTSCKTATGYPQFDFGDLEKMESAEYLTSSSVEYLRCGNCAFVPTIRANTPQEYVVDFVVYTANSDAVVDLKEVEILHNGNPLITSSLGQVNAWEKTGSEIYSTVFRAATIPMDSVDFKDGDTVQLKLRVAVTENGSTSERIIVLESKVWQYKTVVFPV